MAIAAIAMTSCKPPVIFPTYTLEVDEDQMSTVPGVLVEQPYGVITLSFSDEIDESVIQNLRLVDYTDPIPTILPKSSINGVSMIVNGRSAASFKRSTANVALTSLAYNMFRFIQKLCSQFLKKNS